MIRLSLLRQNSNKNHSVRCQLVLSTSAIEKERGKKKEERRRRKKKKEERRRKTKEEERRKNERERETNECGSWFSRTREIKSNNNNTTQCEMKLDTRNKSLIKNVIIRRTSTAKDKKQLVADAVCPQHEALMEHETLGQHLLRNGIWRMSDES